MAPWKGLAASARADGQRWPLWLPVALGTGMALYFSADTEPSGMLALFTGAVALGAGVAAWWSGALRPALALTAALALGFAAAKAREVYVAAPLLQRPLIVHLSGRVEGLEQRDTGVRVVLGDLRSGRFASGHLPALARIAIRSGGEMLKPGEGVELTAQLQPPPGPSEPGAADPGRAAYFQSIGAVGFSYGRPGLAPLAHAAPMAAKIPESIETLRLNMTARIRAALPGSDGAIASALITGMRGGIEEDDQAALRDAGLAHVLAIAGLHMALVGLGLFWLVRALLAAIPRVALQYPIKKYAAGAALAGAVFYLLISGAAASATRAFVMLAMMLVAVLLDRPALSMRNLGLAAAILLLLRPDTITEPGFQMSFAAVTALVAVAEWEQQRERLVPHGALYRYLRGIFLTSFIGSLATMPFAIFHFGRATHYAVLGNLLAMPVMGFLVMPSAALSVAAMPFGLESAPLHLMGWGIDVMLAAGRFVSGLPGAVAIAPAFPVFALGLMALGGLWLAIWRRGWRWLGLVPLLAGVAIAAFAPRPDILVAPDGRSIALRGDDGLLHFPRLPKDRFDADNWLLRDGDAREIAAATGAGRCDGSGCVATVKGLVVAMPLRAEAMTEDCARAAIIIGAASNCPGPKLVLTSAAIAQGGGYAVTLSSNIAAISVNQWRGLRPWVSPQ